LVDRRKKKRGEVMAFEDVQAEIGLLLTRMQNEPEDRHELHIKLIEKLNELKAYGMPLPQDLVDLKERLEAEFAAEQRKLRPKPTPRR
jgi:hypothetical protein